MSNFNMKKLLDLPREDKVRFLEKTAELSHVSTEKMLSLYAMLGDDTFALLVLFADDEVKFPRLRVLNSLVLALSRSQEEQADEGSVG